MEHQAIFRERKFSWTSLWDLGIIIGGERIHVSCVCYMFYVTANYFWQLSIWLIVIDHQSLLHRSITFFLSLTFNHVKHLQQRLSKMVWSSDYCLQCNFYDIWFVALWRMAKYFHIFILHSPWYTISIIDVLMYTF